MIKCENVTKNYGERRVLSIPELLVGKGEILALTGANGSGKSTLLRCMAGVIPYEGSIEKNGTVLYMPQKSVCFDMSVLKNVTYSLQGSKKEKEEKATELLRRLGLDSLSKKNALGLSGGEAARLSLARLLVRECDILLLDEPTGAVDIEGTEIIENAIREYAAARGCTVVISTHSPLQAQRLASKVIMLDKGEIAEYCTPEELLLQPKTEFGKKFVDMWRYK